MLLLEPHANVLTVTNLKILGYFIVIQNELPFKISLKSVQLKKLKNYCYIWSRHFIWRMKLFGNAIRKSFDIRVLLNCNLQWLLFLIGKDCNVWNYGTNCKNSTKGIEQRFNINFFIPNSPFIKSDIYLIRQRWQVVKWLGKLAAELKVPGLNPG